jgi:hypothetical protein
MVILIHEVVAVAELQEVVKALHPEQVELELRVLLMLHQHQDLQVELVDLVQDIQVQQDQLIQELVVMVQDQADLH